MHFAHRATRPYVKPSLTNSPGNLRPIRKTPPVVSSRFTLPENKSQDVPRSTEDELVLRKYIDRFRYDQPRARPDRRSIDSDFWWLEEKSETRPRWNRHDDEEPVKSNVPEYIGASSWRVPAERDTDEWIYPRRDRLASDQSSDIGRVSSTGIGSKTSSSSSSSSISTRQTPSIDTAALLRPIKNEPPARPLFTRLSSKPHYGIDLGEDDILYQWRLRRRMEQAQHGEPVTFSSRILHRDERTPLPSRPERHILVSTDTQTESSMSIREMRNATTQTLQDACSQTSPIDLKSLSSSSPSLIKRQRRPFRPTTSIEQSRADTLIYSHPSRTYLSNTLQSLNDSTFTQVTSYIAPNHRTSHVHNFDITETTRRYSGRSNEDDVLNDLTQKRDHLLGTLRDIDQNLAHLNP